MKYHIKNRMYHIEVLSPKQESTNLEERLEKFANKYHKVMACGHVVCIPDNPMGNLAFQGTELIQELELPVNPRQISIHLNTFHTKPNLDWIIETAISLGINDLLVISGDGSERLPKLRGKDLGMNVESVTSVELLKYIHREYPGQFHIGVAFNPYEPPQHELEKMQRKADAGAAYVTTQPVIGEHPLVAELLKFGLPTVIEAWMSQKLYLLSECVGYTIPEDTVYNPLANLETLIENYPNCGYYLSFLGFKTQLPVIDQLWDHVAAEKQECESL